MVLWKTIAVLPNVEACEAIEGGRAAFVPIGDPRVREIDKKYPRHRNFLRHFTDAFGAERRPTVLLVKSNASPQFMTADALVVMSQQVVHSALP